MGRYSGRSSRLILMCVVSIAIFAVEISVAYVGNSLSLASDAFAVLSHLISMIIGLFGVRFSRVRWHKASTYGFSRADVLGAFGNSVFATALMFSIFVEAVKRFINPQKTEKELLVLIIGATGLGFNVLNYVIFMECCYCHAPPGDSETGDSPNDQKIPEGGCEKKKEKKSEALNIRGVLLHVMGDALGSVVVVVTATIFYVRPLGDAPCNWQCYIDPSLTIVMVFIILSSAFPLMKETSTILLQMVPKGVNMQLLTDRLARVPGVSSLHEVHVWELAGGKNIATLHIKCQTPSDYQDASYKIRKIFHEAGVHSVTIQPEYADHKTLHLLCSSPCISKSCDSHLCCSQREPPRAETNGYREKNERSLSAQHRDSNSRNSDIEIPMEDPVAEESVKNAKNSDVSDDKSQLGSTRF
ncbi:PREDICTED: zinc transporter 10 isoform X2 [Sturnus vulgaris]|uniref:zinc transporter 10 isoform X2 n=1 Tax=Sturnus vulgaris TaxID=9172 RepID=UPI00071AA5D1|nr:PREDICTED: zinc transporter 10 isoform X2 [Sturnus vulgaris]